MEVESFKKDAAHMACNLVRQFVNIAVGGMAFTVGLSLAVEISSCLFWAILIILGLSVATGLLFQMHYISLVSVGKYEVYRPSIRLLSASQIILVAIGVILLCIAIR